MKYSLLFVVVFALFLSSCYESPIEKDFTDTSSLNVPENENQIVTFDHYEELFDFVLNQSPVSPENEIISEQTEFLGFLQYCEEHGILLPMNAGSYVPLIDHGAATKISLMSSELFSMPWIWYYTIIDGKSGTIRYTVLDQETTAYASGRSASEVIRAISPNAPNVDNYQEKANYRNIFDQQIILDDRTVSALVSETVDSCITIKFVYENALIIIDVRDDQIPMQWLQALSFEYITDF